MYVLKMSASYNAHAELPSQSNYSNYVCCSGISGTSCSGGTAFLKLSALTNAQVEQANYFNYSNSACLTPLASETISCTYSTSCSSGYVCLASISNVYNAHIAQCGVYSTQVCCIATGAPTFDFLVAVNPTSDSATQGSSVSTNIIATLLSGTTQPVYFSVSGLPSGASIPPISSCNPTCSSSMTINTAGSTPTGTYSINVCGTGGGLTRCVTYQLTVTAASAQITTPGVTTNTATSITTSSATLNGTLNDIGRAANCLVWFEWGPTTSLGNSTAVQTRTSTGNFSANISSLNSNTTYYFKAFAKNGGSW
ncbi:MAG: hypothetical protein ISS83_01415 [Candidatus Pacebacteria bacterium]|nr:hypothetical protein [Candidatus Paceibacterota bacterium]